QKAVLVCILVYLLLFIAQFFWPPALRLVLILGAIAATTTAAVFVFLLAPKVYSMGVGIALAILTLIPCIGFIALLIINAKATSVLKERGIRVGLLGAKMSDFD